MISPDKEEKLMEYTQHFIDKVMTLPTLETPGQQAIAGNKLDKVGKDQPIAKPDAYGTG